MSSINVRQEINSSQINKQLKGPTGALAKELLRKGLRIQNAAKKRCPVDQGRLRASITLKIVTEAGILKAEIGTDVDYALYVHNGTGLFGPTSSQIFPQRGKFMVFQPKGSSQSVFATHTSGQKPVPFLNDALHEVMG